MTDLDQLLPLWYDLRATGVEYVLATVVEVDGSGYRKPGAHMLVAADGRRAGTISGGCLEGDVARKAFWQTERGPVVRRYSTRPEDGEVPFGMGCGGVVHLLLERSVTAGPLLQRLADCFTARQPIAVATVLGGSRAGQRAYFPADSDDGLLPGDDAEPAEFAPLRHIARQAFEEKCSSLRHLHLAEDQKARVRVEWYPARPGLFVFGAGDDAIPLIRMVRHVGWYVTVADGRSHLATRTRFAEAHAIDVLAAGEPLQLAMQATDAAVVMTHSMEQDEHFLEQLLATDLAYIGVLGPRRRTVEMLCAIARKQCHADSRPDSLSASFQQRRVSGWLERLHAPMGLELGGSTPADIALAVIAEIQQTLHGASGLPLRKLRQNSAHDFAENRARLSAS